MTQQDYTYTDKITELRLELRHPNNRGKAFLLLEGDSDARLYKKLCNTQQTKIEAVPGGKHKVREALGELSQPNQILGIIDADFLHLEQVSPSFDNLFFTDFHDLELLMASEDEVFSAVMIEFGINDKPNHPTFKMKLMEMLRFVGYFRWLNEKKQLGLSFKAIAFGDIVDLDNHTIDSVKLVAQIVGRSPNAIEKDITLLKQETEALMNQQHDLFQLCNGHDFMKIVAFFSKNKKKNEDDTAQLFRAIYNISHFKKTRLYRDTHQWATLNGFGLYA